MATPTESNKREKPNTSRSSRESARHIGSLEEGSDDSQAIGPNDCHTNIKARSTLNVFQVIYQSLPTKVKWILDSVIAWLQGPIPARPFRIRPLLPTIQSSPRCLANFVTRYIFIHWLIVWSLICGILFIFILARSEASCEIESYGSPLRLSCVSRLW